MKKIKMARGTTLTFEEGCNKYLENCRQRNLREGTIGHYKQSYTQFYIAVSLPHIKGLNDRSPTSPSFILKQSSLESSTPEPLRTDLTGNDS